jgi:hypothetical protein
MILSTELEDIFFNGSKSVGPDSEAQGIRKDRNGYLIRRDNYDDRESNCGWGVCVIGQPSGLQIRLPMRLRELDALGDHGSQLDPCPDGIDRPLPDNGLAPSNGPSHGNSEHPIDARTPQVEWDSPTDRPELSFMC